MDRIRAAIAAALRAEAAANKVSYRTAAERSGKSLSTIHRYMNAERDIKLVDLWLVSEAIGSTPAIVMASAQQRLRDMENES